MSRSLDSGRWRSRALRIGGVLVLLGAAGLLVAASGVIPIKASSGHWPITRWFLEFSMRRSVETHTLASEVPDLSDPALIHRGAGHYALGCEPCHGSPDRPPSSVTRGMTPRPPWLPEEVTRWSPVHLHYIVRHGIKFTGMPAWPAPARDDEVWAVVAFLRLLPALDPDEYRRLALGEMAEPIEVGPAAVGPPDPAAAAQDPSGADAGPPPPAPPAGVMESCARCHGVDGGGRGVGAFPRLAGQSRLYLEASLRAYARGDRPSGIMEPVAAALDEEEIATLARWYASRSPRSPADPAAPAAPADPADPADPAAPADPADPADLVRGESIARAGVPGRKVPSCVHCHGPGTSPRHPLYPSLAGQDGAYLVLQLRLFEEGRRGGSPFAHVMGEVAHHLTPQQRIDVAGWYATLGPDERDP